MALLGLLMREILVKHMFFLIGSFSGPQLGKWCIVCIIKGMKERVFPYFLCLVSFYVSSWSNRSLLVCQHKRERSPKTKSLGRAVLLNTFPATWPRSIARLSVFVLNEWARGAHGGALVSGEHSLRFPWGWQKWIWASTKGCRAAVAECLKISPCACLEVPVTPRRPWPRSAVTLWTQQGDWQGSWGGRMLW